MASTTETLAGPERAEERRNSPAAGPAAPAADRPPRLVLPERRPRQRAARASLAVVSVLALTIAGNATVIGGLQHRSAQVRELAVLRERLAAGTAPIGEADAAGKAVRLGAPVALLRIPSAGVREVVLQGTTSGVLMSGPGHRRGTPFPGQAGTSVVFGRRAAYGGPFAGLASLRAGAKITFTTGQGVSTYRVTGVRRAGDPAPLAPAAGEGRLQLLTAAGSPFVPSGVVRVDADLVGPAFARTPVAAGALPAAERPLGTDPSTAWALVLWLQALVALAIGATWSWIRWGRHPTWIVFLPPVVLVALAATGQFVRLLPNVL